MISSNSDIIIQVCHASLSPVIAFEGVVELGRSKIYALASMALFGQFVSYCAFLVIWPFDPSFWNVNFGLKISVYASMHWLCNIQYAAIVRLMQIDLLSSMRPCLRLYVFQRYHGGCERNSAGPRLVRYHGWISQFIFALTGTSRGKVTACLPL